MAWDNRDLWEFAGDCGAEMKEECAAGICGVGGGEGRCGSRNEIQEVKEVKEAKTVHHRELREH